jgi:interferon gamma-inducible protein 30
MTSTSEVETMFDKKQTLVILCFLKKKNCFTYYNSNVMDQMEYIGCAMSNLTRSPMDTVNFCSQNLSSLLKEKLITCANGKLGNSLLYAAGVRTIELIPKKNWIPWIVVNNIHTDQIQNDAETNLVKVVCQFYRVII